MSVADAAVHSEDKQVTKCDIRPGSIERSLDRSRSNVATD
jgi:hypothetical protein